MARSLSSLSLVVLVAAMAVLFSYDNLARPRSAEATFPGQVGKIAFRNAGIYVMNADGSNQMPLASTTIQDSQPAWSADGSRIAFTSSRDGNAEIYVMNADGSNQTRVTNNPAGDYQPAWSPDGTKIAFMSDRDGNREIYKMDANGANQTRLTNNSAIDEAPNWQPNGNKIAFGSVRDGNFEIYVMNADGSNETRLTITPFDDEDGPVWSPDGTKLVFPRGCGQSPGCGTPAIVVMNANGIGYTPLVLAPTNPPTLYLRAVWLPDASRIVAARVSLGDGRNIFSYKASDGTGELQLTTSGGDGPDAQPLVAVGGITSLPSGLPDAHRGESDGRYLMAAATLAALVLLTGFAARRLRRT